MTSLDDFIFKDKKSNKNFDGKQYTGKNFHIYYQNSKTMSKVIMENSIQTIVTSPPYGNLRDYGIKGQIGIDQSYGEYINSLDDIWRECYKILKPSGTFWLNVGHQMVKSNLIYIGSDLYAHLIKVGFKLIRIFYWYKKNYASGYSKRNLLQNFEPIYCYAKDVNKVKFYEENAIYNDLNNDKTADYPLSYWILVRKGGSLKGSNNNPHPAPYPNELVERVIEISTDSGDKVLDPFLGSGTTTKIAVEKQRYGIGFEINSEFYKLNKCRMEMKDNFSKIEDWIKIYNAKRRLGHENQKMKNF